MVSLTSNLATGGLGQLLPPSVKDKVSSNLHCTNRQAKKNEKRKKCVRIVQVGFEMKNEDQYIALPRNTNQK
jgi:hypothetical protein